jgi:hypothetical protein
MKFAFTLLHTCSRDGQLAVVFLNQTRTSALVKENMQPDEIFMRHALRLRKRRVSKKFQWGRSVGRKNNFTRLQPGRITKGRDRARRNAGIDRGRSGDWGLATNRLRSLRH